MISCRKLNFPGIRKYRWPGEMNLAYFPLGRPRNLFELYRRQFDELDVPTLRFRATTVTTEKIYKRIRHDLEETLSIIRSIQQPIDCV